MSDISHGLFRPESIQHQKNNWLGKAVLISQFPTSVIILFSVIFFACLAGLIISGHYTRRIHVVGEIITYPHPINITNPQQGYVTQTFVAVGDIIAKGDPIYSINVDRVTTTGAVASIKLKAIDAQIQQIDQIIQQLNIAKKATLDNLQQQIVHYQKTTAQSQQTLDTIQKGIMDIQHTVKDYEQYRQKGLINKEQLNNQRYTLYQQQNLYQNLYTQHHQHLLEITNLNSAIAIKATEFNSQISQYLAQREDLSHQLIEAEAGQSLLITAPTHGRIESLSATNGQMVKVGDHLAQMVLGTERVLYLLLWIPNDALPYLSVGDIVKIRYDAFPFEKFGQFTGNIHSISSVPAPLQELSSYQHSPIHTGNIATYYKTMVTLEKTTIDTNIDQTHKRLMLSNGMKAQTTLFLEKRPIYQWILSPFYDMKRSILGSNSE